MTMEPQPASVRVNIAITRADGMVLSFNGASDFRSDGTTVTFKDSLGFEHSYELATIRWITVSPRA